MKIIRFIILISFLCACEQQPIPTFEILKNMNPEILSTATQNTIQLHSTITPDILITIDNTQTTPDPDLQTPYPVPQLKPTNSASIIFASDNWQEMPVIPELDEKILEIYQLGLQLGNNPKAFSKIGDCGSTPTWFLGDFDRGARFYKLGDYQYLNKVINYYQGSFNRKSLAAESGFNVSSVLTPLWSDKAQCSSNETPLACEYRVHKPIIAFITLGANDVFHLNNFEPQMHKIIEFSLANGVIPILSTKPDNVEKNHQINSTIVKLAIEYQIPLWNYWLAVQPLPNHGLQEDGVHITWKGNQFNDPETLNWGWPIRNLTALQVLDAIWRYINQPNPSL